MVPRRKTVARGSQKEKVYRRGDEILELLRLGATVKSAHQRLGFENMPYKTFARNVANLRKLYRPSTTPHNLGDGSPPVTSAINPAAPAGSDTAISEPQANKSTRKKENKPAPKRRKFVDMRETVKPDKEDSYNPKDWKFEK